MNTVFLLSPARCDGRRAKMLLNPSATFELARRTHAAGAPVGEIFSFLSGLYFRGKLAYAHAFGRRAERAPSAFVITTDRGLLIADTVVTRSDLLAFAKVDIALAGDQYVTPLARDVERLATETSNETQFVLLGSIATGKYADTLTRILGERLRFPAEFVGRGDMSRGGLLLRCVAEQRELEYIPVIGAVRHGKRPAKLAPLPRSRR
ncbi:MAG: hypothetical protein ACREBE_02785 [bacterium]